jgi:putative SOS response-associated peptidase YedK
MGRRWFANAGGCAIMRRMCGRFTLRTPLGLLVEQFLAEPAPQLQLALRYNIAPTQSVPVVRICDGRRQLTSMHWGLIPSWAKDPKIAAGTINARADTVGTKPAFRTALKKRRCLVIADGFYEWQKQGKVKQPFLYEIEGGRPFAFAGLWESWRGPDHQSDTSLESCTILTTEANELARKIHDRMPVILSENDYAAWLDPENANGESLAYLLEPFPADRMTVRPVNRFVNNARNEGPECLEAAWSGETNDP